MALGTRLSLISTYKHTASHSGTDTHVFSAPLFVKLISDARFFSEVVCVACRKKNKLTLTVDNDDIVSGISQQRATVLNYDGSLWIGT